MRYQSHAAITCMVMVLSLCVSSMLPASTGFAADKPSEALNIFLQYCDIVPRREIIGQSLDPNLTAEQANQARIDTHNNAEKKLLALRQRLAKLDRASVEKVLHGQMARQDPNDTDNLMCALEIVARIYPKEYEDYAKLIKPGVDQSDFVNYIRDTFLGMSGMQPYPNQT